MVKGSFLALVMLFRSSAAVCCRFEMEVIAVVSVAGVFFLLWTTRRILDRFEHARVSPA